MELLVRSLIKISLIGFIITFVIIFYIENNYKLEPVSVDDITIKEIERNVRIDSEIIKIRRGGNNVFMEIKGDNSTMKGVIFNSNATLTENKNYSIEGVIKYYQGELELVAHKIENIN